MNYSGKFATRLNCGRGADMPRPGPKKRTEIVRLFAERLRSTRQARGMTQAELSQLAGVSVTHLSELESASIAPGIDLVDRLARALGTTAADLLPAAGPSDPLPVLTEQAKRLLETLIKEGDREAFVRLNPFLALLVEASSKRGWHKRK